MRADRVEGDDQRKEDPERHAARVSDQKRDDDQSAGDDEEHRDRRPPPPSQRHRHKAEQDGKRSAPAGHNQAGRRVSPELELDLGREHERNHPVAPPLRPRSYTHTAKVLPTARERIIPGPDLGDRLLTLTGYETTPRDHPGALPQIAVAADDTRHAAA